MSLIKWSPFFFEPMDGMDRFMDDAGSLVPRSGSSIAPPVDMYETKDSLVVETPLAGVDPKQLEISIENGVLSIRGSSERRTEVDEKNYYRKEVRYGSMFRQIPLPTRVVEDKAEASFDNGLLKITIPKASATSSIKVEVKDKK